MASNGSGYVNSSSGVGNEFRIQITGNEFELTVVHADPIELKAESTQDLSYLVYVPKYIEGEQINWGSLSNIKGANMSITSYVFPAVTVDNLEHLDHTKVFNNGDHGVIDVLLFKPMYVITGTVINIKIRLVNYQSTSQIYHLLASFKGNMNTQIKASSFKINGRILIDNAVEIPTMAKKAIIPEDEPVPEPRVPTASELELYTDLQDGKFYYTNADYSIIRNNWYDSIADAKIDKLYTNAIERNIRLANDRLKSAWQQPTQYPELRHPTADEKAIDNTLDLTKLYIVMSGNADPLLNGTLDKAEAFNNVNDAHQSTAFINVTTANIAKAVANSKLPNTISVDEYQSTAGWV
jgi:hypothetical protein